MKNVYSKFSGIQVAFGVDGMAVHHPQYDDERRTSAMVVAYTHQYDHEGNIKTTEQLIITPEAAEELGKELIVAAAKARYKRQAMEDNLRAEDIAAVEEQVA